MTAPAHSPHQSYRPDIDGLRSLAVLPVVLFHFGFPGFFGGFIGVDVFFVISGYLITGIIVRELREGNFSILEFYRRRTLRIFPALFAMLAVVSVLAAVTMLPAELTRYGRSLLATTTFLSNVLFYFQTGYFAPDTHTVALLHTWSLAVEEQFYLFWPLILAGLHARSGASVRWISLVITALSFGLAVWLLKIDASATFYLIPTRAWELMIGALLAVTPALTQLRRPLREVLSAGGVLTILFGVKFLNEGMPFPGALALLPCLGAAAIIAAGSGGPTLAGRALSLKPLVFIGKISFSLYLWHWPVVVFVQLGLMREQTWPVRIAELLVSLLLAVLSWRFVEQPFRTGVKHVSSPRILAGSAVVMAAGAALGLTAMLSGGLPGRYNAEQLALARYESYDGDKLFRGGSCFVVNAGETYDAQTCLGRRDGAKSVLIVGDSHAAQLWPGLHEMGKDLSVLQATQTGCRPVLGKPGDALPPCRRFFSNILEQWLPQHPVDVLVLAGRWDRYDMATLPATIAAAQRGAKTVVLVGPIPQYAAALPRFLVREAGGASSAGRDAGLLHQPFALEPDMRAMAKAQGVQYFSMIDALCVNGHCQALAAPGVPMQFDYGHLTAQGSGIIADKLLKSISQKQTMVSDSNGATSAAK